MGGAVDTMMVIEAVNSVALGHEERCGCHVCAACVEAFG
jgi:hypothetical protein